MPIAPSTTCSLFDTCRYYWKLTVMSNGANDAGSAHQWAGSRLNAGWLARHEAMILREALHVHSPEVRRKPVTPGAGVAWR